MALILAVFFLLRYSTEAIQQDLGEISDAVTGLEPPSPGPIITVEPSDTATTHWEIDSTPLTTGDFGDSCYLREDAFGELSLFKLTYEDDNAAVHTRDLKSLKLVIGSDELIVSEVGTKLDWAIESCKPLKPCDWNGNGIPAVACVNKGLPPELDGSINTSAPDGFSAVVVSGPDPVTFIWAGTKADQ
jgi:hypothetical protein